jgi:hypothetical protein
MPKRHSRNIGVLRYVFVSSPAEIREPNSPAWDNCSPLEPVDDHYGWTMKFLPESTRHSQAEIILLQGLK